MERYEKKKSIRNATQPNICYSKIYEENVKSVTLSREFIDTFIQIMFLENS